MRKISIMLKRAANSYSLLKNFEIGGLLPQIHKRLRQELHLSAKCLKREFQLGTTVRISIRETLARNDHSPCVRTSKFYKEFHSFEFDASGVGISGSIMQEVRPTAFLSQSLQDLFLFTYEKEMLALVQAA